MKRSCESFRGDTERERARKTNCQTEKKTTGRPSPPAPGSYFVGVVSAVVPTVTRPGWRGGRRQAAVHQLRVAVRTVPAPVDPHRACRYCYHTAECFYSEADGLLWNI